MQNNFKAYYQSPLGYVEINANAKSIKSIQFIDGEPDEVENSTEIIAVCIKQLDQYFNGHRKKFDFKLQMDGTPFQIMVWNELLKIEQGVTISYNQLAMQIKDTRLARAIGNAVSKNKLLIVVPCHRVIGNNGQLVGYAGGIWRKQWLLEFERSFLPNYQSKMF